jgi:intracellular sulfur oxidation DsrE/DsrF family protein
LTFIHDDMAQRAEGYLHGTEYSRTTVTVIGKGTNMHIIIKMFFLALLLVGTSAIAGEPTPGPVIDNYGPVFAVPQGSYNLVADQQYKVVMDVGKGPDNPAELNRNIESAARFLNMQARNGTPPENLKMAIVLHGSGARAALNEQAHSEHFSVPNGSKGLVEALGNAGVDIYICGQTAAYYGFGPNDLLPQVTVAVSAMTVHVRLQQEGYRAILF